MKTFYNNRKQTRWKVLWESTTPRESYCGLPTQWGCTVNETAIDAVLIAFLHEFAYSVCSREISPQDYPIAKFGGFVANSWEHLPHATPTIRSIKCKKSPVYGVFWSLVRYFYLSLPIATKHKLGLPFFHRNFPIKFGTNPSTTLLVIVVTDRHTQTHKPTPVITYRTRSLSRGE